jgi:pseudouridylate synthase
LKKVNKELFAFSAEVLEALQKGKPIVALESTIIAHGMPYPQNLEVANMLENICRENNVTPATICIIKGRLKVGINEEELEILAKNKDVKKVTTRNIGACLSRKETGATTVASTLAIAARAGIDVFATGGTGGVHRGAEDTFDISADMKELSRNPVILVSAGAKAILDLPKTLEYLETLSVPVYGFKTDKFPAFYSRETDLPVMKAENAKEIANIYKLNKDLNLQSGILVANPIPKDYEIPSDEINQIINDAIWEATEKDVKGAELTPFLLAKIVELTHGRSLAANIELAKNNVLVACEIAKEVKKEARKE